ncbi:hypothetical protein D9O36_08125 [Zobellia amurskyensis]|uniref:Uncharacterized protein n=1 Tax=Zobellia amurskyensis TaxID=248905 RepID=A0A7X2ZSW2_9FLAO|nr:hypothetical protein [Zobellia amurskyensis]MUH35802.1 hypothetical protein [Zobellia amurskyensis]
MKTVPYLRVGTSYYKLVQAPTIAGHFNEILVHWNIETIRQDHGKDYLGKVPKLVKLSCWTILSFVFVSRLSIFAASRKFPKQQK